MVFAGWEGGSAAFAAVDEYPDIDLIDLVADDASCELLYASAEHALETVSHITGSHDAPPGRYYMLKNGRECFLVDLSFLPVGAPDHYLEVERHGHILPLFDKGDWLRSRPLNHEALAARRMARFRELEVWFVPSQSFPRKAILRGQHGEAMNAYWMTTIKPLVELYVCVTLPCAGISGCVTSIAIFLRRVRSGARFSVSSRSERPEAKLAIASAWGATLLGELRLA